MNSETPETEFHRLPRWAQRMLPFLSALLSASAFSYAAFIWLRTELEPVHGLRMVFFAAIGLILLFSAVLYIFNKETAWRWFIGGLTCLPILLFLQLILFLLNLLGMAVASLFEGTLPEPLRMFIEHYPSQADLAILSALFVAGVLWVANRLRKRNM